MLAKLHFALPALGSAILFCGLCGCGLAPATGPGDLAFVQPVSTQPHVGNVYLLRGWIGIFSYGVETLTDKLNAAGIRACQYQDDQWQDLARAIVAQYQNHPHAEPLVLIGHSYGADDCMRIARYLQPYRIHIDLVITLDPCIPPPVPDNITACYNLYQTHGLSDNLPWMRGIPLTLAPGSTCRLQNVDIRKDRPDLVDATLDHYNIARKPAIQQECLTQVLKVCIDRAQWSESHHAQEEK